MKKILAGVAAGLMAAAGSASAVPLVLDGGFQTYDFSGDQSPWNTTFEITVASEAWIVVTDAFLSGDRFKVILDGETIGLTSVPTVEGDQIGSDYTAAAFDPRWSTGQFKLDAGMYVITGFVTESPFGGGTAAIAAFSQQFDAPGLAPVPVPAAALLFAPAALAFARRRKAK